MSDRQTVKELKEPLLRIDNIQGNVLPGFNKDFQALLFLKIVDVTDFKRWLKVLIPSVTTVTQVLTFRRLLNEDKRSEPPQVKATWINMAFSHSALMRLDMLKDSNFKDRAFREGLWRRSASLGDPTDEGAEGNSQNWVVGGPKNEADVVMIVASDDRLDLFEAVTCIETSIYMPRADNGKPDQSGIQLIFKQYGANLPGPLVGHEHFGFRDGISQPGVRGLISKKSEDFLTLRQNPKNRDQGKPGQDLLWPGEFVFGYPGQDKKKKVKDPGEVSDAGPSWAQDGSFLVFRRLRQDVGTFHKFLHDMAQKLKLDPDFLGAKCVGRWASGAPILRAPEQDTPELAQDDKNNDFEFQKKDAEGKVCPFASHIRKVYPRDDEVKSKDESRRLNEAITQTHRLLRRGIPYGELSLSSPRAPAQDSVDRGLLFLAYQTSIEDQFEFVQQQANNPDFKDKEASYDPIIGQNGCSKERERHFKVTFKKGKGKEQEKTVAVENEWVIPTGGGYFFAPSIEALHMFTNLTVANGERGGVMAAQKEKYITVKNWARVWAKALLDPEFKVKLETDPIIAVRAFTEEAEHKQGASSKGGAKGEKGFPSLPSYDVLYELEEIDGTIGKEFARSFSRTPGEEMAHGFSRMSYDQLQAIIRGEKKVSVETSELIKIKPKKLSQKTKTKK